MAHLSSKVSLLLLLVAVAYAAPQPKHMPPLCTDVTCPSSYMPGNFLAADPYNPCGYCQCIWQSPVKMACADGLGWSDMYSQCIPMPGC